MNFKRTLVAVVAAGTMMLSMAAGASAHPNHEHANCVAHIAHHDGGEAVAALAQAGDISGQATGSDTCEHQH
jgi:hypothetical protein